MSNPETFESSTSNEQMYTPESNEQMSTPESAVDSLDNLSPEERQMDYFIKNESEYEDLSDRIDSFSNGLVDEHKRISELREYLGLPSDKVFTNTDAYVEELKSQKEKLGEVLEDKKEDLLDIPSDLEKIDTKEFDIEDISDGSDVEEYEEKEDGDLVTEKDVENFIKAEEKKRPMSPEEIKKLRQKVINEKAALAINHILEEHEDDLEKLENAKKAVMFIKRKVALSFHKEGKSYVKTGKGLEDLGWEMSYEVSRYGSGSTIAKEYFSGFDIEFKKKTYKYGESAEDQIELLGKEGKSQYDSSEAQNDMKKEKKK